MAKGASLFCLQFTEKAKDAGLFCLQFTEKAKDASLFYLQFTEKAKDASLFCLQFTGKAKDAGFVLSSVHHLSSGLAETSLRVFNNSNKVWRFGWKRYSSKQSIMSVEYWYIIKSCNTMKIFWYFFYCQIHLPFPQQHSNASLTSWES